MNLSKLSSRLTLALGIVFLSCLAWAEPGEQPSKTPIERLGQDACRPPCDEAPGFLPPELQGLVLSEAQQDRVFMIFHEQAPVLRSAMKKEIHAEEELRKFASKPGFDEASSKAIAEAAGKAHAEILFLHARARAQIQALLTPEQRERIGHMGHRPPPPEL